MTEIILGFVLVVVVIALALYGLIKLLTGGASKPSGLTEFSGTKNDNSQRCLKQDVQGSSHLLNYLYLQKRISRKQYDRLRGYLDQEYGGQWKLADELPKADGQVLSKPKEITESKQSVEPELKSGSDAGSKVDVEFVSDLVRDAGSEPIVTESPAGPPATEASPLTGKRSLGDRSPGKRSPGNRVSNSPAPWELPDPPPRAPKRAFGEVMSGFMLEKNIRWGELASGILIVGSAVGLVVSLREELRETIPYFSSMMFLLITAAIHAAGIYTLKKWKLRKTSRGTLLIGLLLVPLNILAACILSGGEDRRALSDPLLWLALSIGLGSFTAMTWYSSKCLFRKGQWPLVLSIVGCCISTLLINRLVEFDGSSLHKLLWSLPPALSFLGGTAIFFNRQWTREKWSEKSVDRMFVFLGLSSFAALAASSMIVVRADSKTTAIVALMPLLSLICLMTASLGRIVWQRAVGKSQQSHRLTGLSLHILGWGLIAFSLLYSAANPTVLLINSALTLVGMIWLARHQKEPRLLMAAWFGLALFVFSAVNLWVGKLDWDAWAGLDELRNAALSGQTGLALLATGAGVVGVHGMLAKRFADNPWFIKTGFISGATMLLVGCGLALVASFLNPESQFDVFSATFLLGIAAGCGLAGAVYLSANPVRTSDSNSTDELVKWVAIGVVGILFAFLFHLLIWNRWSSDWANQTAFGIGANWTLVFAIHGFVLASVALLARILGGIDFQSGRQRIESANALSDRQGVSPMDDRQGDRPTVPVLLAEYTHISLIVGLIGAFYFALYQTWLSTGIAVAMSIGLLMLVYVQASYRRGVGTWVDLFTASTVATVGVCVCELLTRFNFCPGPGGLRFWLILGIALSLWAIIVMLVVWVLEKRSSFKRFAAYDPRFEWWLIHAVVVGAVGLIGVGLVGASNLELFKDAGQPWVLLGPDRNWGFAFLFSMFAALLVSALRRPVGVTGAAIGLVWFLAWGIGADFFADINATGTALRWLLPIGGAVGAVMVALRKPLIPVWALTRNRLGFKGRSTWSADTTQSLINGALGWVAFIVLLISTIAIGQVMMNGGVSALGGPDKGSLFGDMKKDASYGLPVAIMVGTFLLYAISERRKWLATAGSLVFQYCVLLSVVLLFISPHPKMATSWFVNILQAVSVGMTGYGFVWFWFRDRIERTEKQPITATAAASGFKWLPQIEIHTVINGLLITALAVLVLLRFYRYPALAGGWINSVGGWLGVVAWAIFGSLAFLVWKRQLTQAHRMSSWMLLVCWLGLVLVGMVAALVDRSMFNAEIVIPWRTFNVILFGMVLVCLSQTVLLWLERGPVVARRIFSGETSRSFQSIRGDQSLPLLLSGAILLAFAVRGIGFNAGAFWGYFAAILALIGCVTFAGICRQSPWLAFVSAGLTSLLAIQLVNVDPYRWFSSNHPDLLNVLCVALTMLAMIWSGFYVWLSVCKREAVRPTMTSMSNVVLIGGSIWALLQGLIQWADGMNGLLTSAIENPWGIAAMLGPLALGMLHLWNDRRFGWVVALSIWLVGTVVFCVSSLVNGYEVRGAAVVWGLGAVVAFCGLSWSKRSRWFGFARQCHAPRLVQIERSMSLQFPIFGFLLGGLVMLAGLFSSMFLEPRLERYLFAISPFGVAIGFGCFSDRSKRRWMQLLALRVLTAGAVFISWADLQPGAVMIDSTRMFVRVLLVLSAAMFVYGWLVSRWVRPDDGWLQSLREMSIGTCLAALVAFVIVLLQESRFFVPDVGCGVPLAEAVTVALVVLAMVAGLIAIAVLPKHDPFSLSLNGRMGYVYAAQVAVAMLAVHLYLTMPFLFQIGIKNYWPYIAMVLCFGGVGIAQVLERRELTVLAQPLMTTAALLPVAVSVCIWGIDSRADASLVMLFAGLAYLMISYTQSSPLAGAAGGVLGNLALWLFYNKFDGFSITEHSQLWLIPPAVSTLIAVHLSRNSLTRKQVGLIRYICMAVIYLSSTSEIFISGLGDNLWPPMVLALLAVGGILAGMILRIRAFLYLGIVFLLLALVTMVSHAHHRFEHVWPWWAFGFSLGVAILVMFGLFEKKKKEMDQVFGQLRQWDY